MLSPLPGQGIVSLLSAPLPPPPLSLSSSFHSSPYLTIGVLTEQNSYQAEVSIVVEIHYWTAFPQQGENERGGESCLTLALLHQYFILTKCHLCFL